MKKKALIFFLSAICAIRLFSNADEAIKQADQLDFDGRHKEALDLLTNFPKDKNTDIKLIYRIGIQAFEVSNLTDSKKEKIKIFDAALEILKSYLDVPTATNRDKADILHWYMVTYASKIKLLGIFGGRESLTIVPELFKTMDKCIELDPSYAGAYFFKAKLYGEVPSFLGGSKVKMGNQYIKAFLYSDVKEKILMLYNAGAGFTERNWTRDKKKKEFEKAGYPGGDGTPIELSDREYAYDLFMELKTLFEKQTAHSVRDQKCYNEAIKLMKTLKS